MKKTILCLAGMLLLTAPESGWANDLNAGGQKAVVRTLSAYTLGKTGIVTGGGLKYATEYDYVSGQGGGSPVTDGSGNAVSRDAPHLLSGNVYAGYGLFSCLDMSIDLPLYADITGWGDTASGIGDLELAIKAAYPFQTPHAFLSHAYYLNVIFPTGDKDVGFFPRHSYYIKNDPNNSGLEAFSVNAVYFNPIIAWTCDFTRIKYPAPVYFHANFGGVVAKAKSGSAVMAALALEVKPLPFLTLFTELTGESRVKYYTDFFSIRSFNNDPFRLTPGVRFDFSNGLYAIVSGDFGFSDDSLKYRANWDRGGYHYSTKAIPRWAGQICFGWTGWIRKPDRDRDGIIDSKDKCPGLPEDRDGWDDDDGCPDPDNDGDLIPDEHDQCPDKPARCSGCPQLDADKDGVMDDKDACPQEKEDMDGFEDGDGCPDPDNDQDGLRDIDDKCPNLSEDKDGFEDVDGCPESDNDDDGIFDVADKCPNEAGTVEHNGCPAPKRTEELGRTPLVLTGVTFESGRAVLTQRSFAVMNRVAESLREWPQVTIEVQGHTDSRGDNAMNLQLSQARAEAVRLYLIQQGVAPERLTAVGYGEDRPVASNNTAAGRRQNRRVELQRVY
ncbi:MAG: OmpA family protein [Chitinispirillaceae bacterium]|nr:OmpA family protein [Chitinispirillaceae bacterium]